MKLHVASDLHLHGDKGVEPDPRVRAVDADVLILAGDIDSMLRVGERYAGWPYDVIYVRGNHDTYFSVYENAVREAATRLGAGRVRMLERSCTHYRGVRILGCCLWTDFALVGRVDDAMTLAAFSGGDYKANIRADGKRLTPEDTLMEHRLSVGWLERELKQRYAGSTVVVTHHAPHARSLSRGHGINSFSAAFASDLSRLMRHVSVWIHGHIHSSADYKVRRCRVVCNPAGSASRPNSQFIPDLVIEV
ncbi:metallophosphoesterase family protein [Burkholderia sp. PU8-34]